MKDKNGKEIKLGDIVLVFGQDITKCEGSELHTKYGTYYTIERIDIEDCVLDPEDLEILDINPKTFYNLNGQELQKKLRHNMLRSVVEDALK